MARRYIHQIMRNHRGAVIIYGALGVRKCKSTIFTNQSRYKLIFALRYAIIIHINNEVYYG